VKRIIYPKSALFSKLSKLRILLDDIRSYPSQNWILIIGVVTYVFVFSTYCIYKYEFFRTGYFDFGQEVQYVWLLVHGHVVSLVLARPFMFLVGAGFLLYPSPSTLLIIVSFLLGIGAIPIFLLGRLELKNDWYALLIALAYLISPAIWGINQYEYHNEAVTVPFLLFAIYFYRARMLKSYIISLLLALSASEVIVVIGLFIALMIGLDYFFPKTSEECSIFHNKKTLYFIISSIAIVFLFSVYLELTVYVPHYALATVPLSGYTFSGSFGFVNPFAALANPGFSLAYDWQLKFQYLIYVFGSLAFLPLISLRRLLPAMPWLGVVFLYSPMTNGNGGVGEVYALYSQWGSFLIPFLFISSVFGLKEIILERSNISQPRLQYNYVTKILTVVLLVTIFLSLTTGALSPIQVQRPQSSGDNTVPTSVNPNLWYHGVWPTPVPDAAVLNYFVSLVPSNASILTQNVIASKMWANSGPIYVTNFAVDLSSFTIQKLYPEVVLVDYNLSSVDSVPVCSTCTTEFLTEGNYTLAYYSAQTGIYMYFLSADLIA
jgi:uncharacterized membrane protein